MISKKVFVSDGINKRFLSDFIIRSEQFTRVYNYVYDPGGIDGSIDPASGLYVRVTDAPTSLDLQTIDKWDLVDNSISFYISPHTGSKVWIEVATTAEEFGDTLIQPTVAQAEAARDIAVAKALQTDADATATAADVVLTHADVVLTHADVVLTHADAASTAADAIATAADAAATAADVLSTNADAASTAADAIATAADAASTAADALATAADVVSSGTNATNAQLKAWEAEAFRLTAQSYATEAEDVLVNVVTSNGNGTFTYTPQAGVYSALHWDAKAVLASVSAVQKAGDTMTGPLSVPAAASGTQVPQVQEVVKKSGDTMTGELISPHLTAVDGGTSAITLDTTATDLSYIGMKFAKQNVQKWINYLDNTATSDLFWQRRTDVGTLTTVMKMIRDTAQVDFSFMPTVASDRVVEWGSNANGIYTKFADGTMICRGSTGLETTNTLFGNLYHQGTPATYTFPVAFTTAPKIVCQIKTVLNQYCWVGSLGTVGSSTFTCRIISQGNTGQGSLDWIAIGTWK